MSVTITVPTLDLEVRCATCNSDLKATHNERTDALVVDQCDKCVGEAKKDGHKEGYDEGIEEGREESTQE